MNQEEVINPPDSVRGFGVRHGQILLQALFYIIVFGVEMALSIALPKLLSETELGNVSLAKISPAYQAYVLCFLITELFGGVICRRYGFKWPMVIFMTIISGVTLNLPLSIREFGVNGLMVCRCIQGLCIGLLFPMPADAISRWVPVKERTVLGTAVYASGILTVAISSFAGNLFSKTNLNWSILFTQFGYLAIVWVVLMVIFGADSPEEYPRKITESELEYITYNRGNVTIGKKVKIPWKQIFTSMPFWAIVVAQIGANWMLFVLSFNVPIYIRYTFDYSMNTNLVPLINLITWVLSFSISGVAQLLINEERTTIGQSRKLFNTLGSCIPALCFILLMFDIPQNEYVGIAIWVIISVTSVGTICGSKLNSNDITCNFAPVVFGTATWISMVFTMVNVTVFAMQSLDNWDFVFLYTAILLVLTNLFYIKFGSGEEQDWSLYVDQEDEEIDLSKSTSRTSIDEGKYLLYVRKQ